MSSVDQIDFIGLKGKTALVTGGGGGIGRSIAENFGALGMKVAVLEIAPDRADAVSASLEKAGVDALVEIADATKRDDVERVIGHVAERFGELDVLVNNVGDFLKSNSPFGESTEAQWDALYDVNLRHMFLVTRAALPLLRKAEGGRSIINVSTIEAFRGIPNLVAYGAFKGAVTGFTQSLAVELGPDNIRVNAIAPETTNSNQVRGTKGVPPENKEYLARWFPIGRFGEPEDSAGAAIYLASSRLSGWVTGTTIHVDGGALAAGAWLQLPKGGWSHIPIIECDGYTPRKT